MNSSCRAREETGRYAKESGCIRDAKTEELQWSARRRRLLVSPSSSSSSLFLSRPLLASSLFVSLPQLQQRRCRRHPGKHGHLLPPPQGPAPALRQGLPAAARGDGALVPHPARLHVDTALGQDAFVSDNERVLRHRAVPVQARRPDDSQLQEAGGRRRARV